MSNSPQELTRWGPFGRLVTWWRGGSKEKRRSERASHRKMKAHREDFVKYALQSAAAAEAEATAASARSLRAEGPPHSRRRVGPTEPIPEWDGDLAGGPFSSSYTPGSHWKAAVGAVHCSRGTAGSRCIVLGERRLVPLLQRSFAGIEVRPQGIDELPPLPRLTSARITKPSLPAASRQQRT